MSHYSVVLITVPDAKTAERISTALVERRLAACVNQLPGLKSRYWWEGKIETAEELLLLAKTRNSLLPELVTVARSLHPHSVPEIIALPIVDGFPPYLNWIGANTPTNNPPDIPTP